MKKGNACLLHFDRSSFLENLIKILCLFIFNGSCRKPPSIVFSYIINQKKKEKENKTKKNLWTTYQKHTCQEKSKKETHSLTLLFSCFVYNVRYAHKHKFWSWAITKKEKETQIRLKEKEKQNKKNWQKSFFWYNTFEKKSYDHFTFITRKKKQIVYNQKKIITDLWKTLLCCQWSKQKIFE
jgi:hypothetical protein